MTKFRLLAAALTIALTTSACFQSSQGGSGPRSRGPLSPDFDELSGAILAKAPPRAVAGSPRSATFGFQFLCTDKSAVTDMRVTPIDDRNVEVEAFVRSVESRENVPKSDWEDWDPIGMSNGVPGDFTSRPNLLGTFTRASEATIEKPCDQPWGSAYDELLVVLTTDKPEGVRIDGVTVDYTYDDGSKDGRLTIGWVMALCQLKSVTSGGVCEQRDSIGP